MLELEMYYAVLMNKLGLTSFYSIPVFLFLICGYVTQSLVLLLWLRLSPGLKIQPNTRIGLATADRRVQGEQETVTVTELGWCHYPFVVFNLTVAAFFAAATCELSSREWVTCCPNPMPETSTLTQCPDFMTLP